MTIIHIWEHLMQSNKYRKSTLAVVISLSLSSQAFAQEAVENNPDDSSQSGQLERITVTAQKREQSVQEVPISISAYNGEALNELGLTETDQLGQFVPGLEISTSSGEGSQLIVFLRGAGLNDFNTNNAGPIGIYSDEVYISSPALTAFQFFDTQRLEVLKGPQGTLYGRNTTGGAIKFISNKPSDEFEFRGRASYATFNTSVVEAAVSGGLTDNVKGRLAFIKNDSDGYMTNLGDPTIPDNSSDDIDASGADSFSYRGFLEFDFDDLNVLVNIHGVELSSKATSFRSLGTTSDGLTRCSDAMIVSNQCVNFLGYKSPDDPYSGFYDGQKEIELDSTGAYVEVNYDFNNMTFTSITAYDEIERFLPEETDASPAKILEVVYGVESQTFSQEFRIVGGNDQFNWLAGAFYLQEDLEQDQTVDIFAEFLPLLGGASDAAGLVLGAPVLFARTNNLQDIETYAIFGQATYAITDKLNVTLGLRYTEEKRNFSALTQLENSTAESELPVVFNDEGEVSFAIPYGPTSGPLVLYERANLEVNSEAFSYRVAIDYKVSPNILSYASVSRGYKSGGFNGGFLDLDPAIAELQLVPFDPEFLTAYEIGFKSDLLDNKLRLDGAFFYNDFSDLQVFNLLETESAPVVLLDNASDASVIGFELDATAILSDGLTLTVSAALMDGELKNFQASTGPDFSGNKIANTPDSSLSTIIRYEHFTNDGAMIAFQTSASYKDDLFFSTENDPVTKQEGYTLVNARVAYENSDGNWSVAAFVNNLADKFYTTNVSNTSTLTGGYTQTLGSPRVVGVELSYKY